VERWSETQNVVTKVKKEGGVVLSLLFFLVGLGFELRVLFFQSRHFALIVLEMESCKLLAGAVLEH
jgi:hypothetical protein